MMYHSNSSLRTMSTASAMQVAMIPSIFSVLFRLNFSTASPLLVSASVAAFPAIHRRTGFPVPDVARRNQLQEPPRGRRSRTLPSRATTSSS
jgi:hypothetical protein